MNAIEKLQRFVMDSRRKSTDCDVVLDGVPLMATVGSFLFKLDSEFGIQYQRTIDFIFRTDDLEGMAVGVGSVVEFNGRKYQVVSPGGEEAVVPSGSHGLSTRIHTMEIKG